MGVIFKIIISHYSINKEKKIYIYISKIFTFRETTGLQYSELKLIQTNQISLLETSCWFNPNLRSLI